MIRASLAFSHPGGAGPLRAGDKHELGRSWPRPRITGLLKAVSRALLALDAFVDSSMFRARRGLLDAWAAIDGCVRPPARIGARARRRRARLRGPDARPGRPRRRADAARCRPSRRRPDDDWLKRTDLAVTFQDRYGVEVGQRGIKHDDAIPFDELPDYFIKAVLATEDRRFFSHFGIDVVGTLARADRQRQGRGRRAGRLLDHPAARQEPLPDQRALDLSARSRRPISRCGSNII